MFKIIIEKREKVIDEAEIYYLYHLFSEEDVRTLDISTFYTTHHQHKQLVTTRNVTESMLRNKEFMKFNTTFLSQSGLEVVNYGCVSRCIGGYVSPISPDDYLFQYPYQLHLDWHQKFIKPVKNKNLNSQKYFSNMRL